MYVIFQSPFSGGATLNGLGKSDRNEKKPPPLLEELEELDELEELEAPDESPLSVSLILAQPAKVSRQQAAMANNCPLLLIRLLPGWLNNS
jgi:hypothetical protein